MTRFTFLLVPLTAAGLFACSQAENRQEPAELSSADVAVYNCGDTVATVTPRDTDSRVILTAEGRTYDLKPVRAASGAKYTASSPADEVEFWSNGSNATLTISGKTYPECLLIKK